MSKGLKLWLAIAEVAAAITAGGPSKQNSGGALREHAGPKLGESEGTCGRSGDGGSRKRAGPKLDDSVGTSGRSAVTADDLKGIGVTFATLKAEAQAQFQKTAKGWDSLAEKLEPGELAQLKAHFTEASENESSNNFRKISGRSGEGGSRSRPYHARPPLDRDGTANPSEWLKWALVDTDCFPEGVLRKVGSWTFQSTHDEDSFSDDDSCSDDETGLACILPYSSAFSVYDSRELSWRTGTEGGTALKLNVSVNGGIEVSREDEDKEWRLFYRCAPFPRRQAEAGGAPVRVCYRQRNGEIAGDTEGGPFGDASYCPKGNWAFLKTLHSEYQSRYAATTEQVAGAATVTYQRDREDEDTPFRRGRRLRTETRPEKRSPTGRVSAASPTTTSPPSYANLQEAETLAHADTWLVHVESALREKGKSAFEGTPLLIFNYLKLAALHAFNAKVEAVRLHFVFNYSDAEDAGVRDLEEAARNQGGKFVGAVIAAHGCDSLSGGSSFFPDKKSIHAYGRTLGKALNVRSTEGDGLHTSSLIPVFLDSCMGGRPVPKWGESTAGVLLRAIRAELSQPERVSVYSGSIALTRFAIGFNMDYDGLRKVRGQGGDSSATGEDEDEEQNPLVTIYNAVETKSKSKFAFVPLHTNAATEAARRLSRAPGDLGPDLVLKSKGFDEGLDRAVRITYTGLLPTRVCSRRFPKKWTCRKRPLATPGQVQLSTTDDLSMFLTRCVLPSGSGGEDWPSSPEERELKDLGFMNVARVLVEEVKEEVKEEDGECFWRKSTSKVETQIFCC